MLKKIPFAINIFALTQPHHGLAHMQTIHFLNGWSTSTNEKEIADFELKLTD